MHLSSDFIKKKVRIVLNNIRQRMSLFNLIFLGCLKAYHKEYTILAIVMFVSIKMHRHLVIHLHHLIITGILQADTVSPRSHAKI